MKTVLVVDDERSTLESINMILKDSYNVRMASCGKEAIEEIGSDQIDLVILDIRMPVMDGLSVLREIKKRSRAAVIMLTAVESVKTAIEAMKLGAGDYIVKPFNVDELRIIVEKTLRTSEMAEELSLLHEELNRDYNFENIVACSPATLALLETVAKVADTGASVLVTGESGTGKELIARAVHHNSGRRNRPFIAVHCAAIPEALLESDLFGHERGAFTGAHETRKGRFEMAHTGTIFLDEVSEMSPAIQGKMLRAIQEKEFMRVGGKKLIRVDVRIVAATNRDIGRTIADGTFREDLYYRLNVVPLEVPPLRKRKEEIPLLADFFLKRYRQELAFRARSFSPDAIRVFKGYDWPGNVRELKNIVERIVSLNREVEVIDVAYLPRDVFFTRAPHVIRSHPDIGGLTLDEAVSEYERQLIEEALIECEGVQTKAAQLLGTTRRILRYKIDKLGISSLVGGTRGGAGAV